MNDEKTTAADMAQAAEKAPPVDVFPEPIASAQVAHEQLPATVRATLPHVDGAWQQFRALAERYPSEYMDEHLTETGWTRKQMLAHITAWHDLTTDRLNKFILTAKPQKLAEEADTINARVARQAVGRTAGEILKEMEISFSRLRRHIVQLSDSQLVAHDAWAAQVIAGNTYDHYAEHIADLALPEPVEGQAPGPR